MRGDHRRWGTLGEIDYRTKVGTKAWKRAHSNKIQHLSAHRRLHMLAEHDAVRHLTDLSVKEKLIAIKALELSIESDT